MSQTVQPISEMKPDPLLEAIDGYRGTIVDLETSTTVLPEEFARGWRELARRMNDVGLQVGDRVILAYGNGPGFIDPNGRNVVCRTSITRAERSAL